MQETYVFIFGNDYRYFVYHFLITLLLPPRCLYTNGYMWTIWEMLNSLIKPRRMQVSSEWMTGSGFPRAYGSIRLRASDAAVRCGGCRFFLLCPWACTLVVCVVSFHSKPCDCSLVVLGYALLRSSGFADTVDKYAVFFRTILIIKQALRIIGRYIIAHNSSIAIFSIKCINMQINEIHYIFIYEHSTYWPDPTF